MGNNTKYFQLTITMCPFIATIKYLDQKNASPSKFKRLILRCFRDNVRTWNCDRQSTKSLKHGIIVCKTSAVLLFIIVHTAQTSLEQALQNPDDHKIKFLYDLNVRGETVPFVQSDVFLPKLSKAKQHICLLCGEFCSILHF